MPSLRGNPFGYSSIERGAELTKEEEAHKCCVERVLAWSCPDISAQPEKNQPIGFLQSP
jgi:hypothetical protein